MKSRIALTAAAIKALTIADVKEVYSGKNNACCCGCKGSYRANSAHKALADKTRGYELDNVNDRQVRKVLSLVQANAIDAEWLSDTQITYVDGERLYMVMLAR